jgi:hypothetical protein
MPRFVHHIERTRQNVSRHPNTGFGRSGAAKFFQKWRGGTQYRAGIAARPVITWSYILMLLSSMFRPCAGISCFTSTCGASLRKYIICSPSPLFTFTL